MPLSQVHLITKFYIIDKKLYIILYVVKTLYEKDQTNQMIFCKFVYKYNKLFQYYICSL